MHSVRHQTYEHPSDVARAALALTRAGKAVALAIVTDTAGGAVRAPGAMMAVSEAGETFGYLSGGCIDADVRLNALNALKSGQLKKLRYGTGSPFADIKLPCGGAIDVQISPVVDHSQWSAIASAFGARSGVALGLDADGRVLLEGDTRFKYRSKLSLRIAGRGSDCLALAGLGQASGFAVALQVPDEDDFSAASHIGLNNITRMTTISDLPAIKDDASTAFVLMFHDEYWETALLKQALLGPAFFVGAVGSKVAHARRSASLLESGVPQADIDRIHGPIGLIPSMRDASMLAISALAQIVDVYHNEAAYV